MLCYCWYIVVKAAKGLCIKVGSSGYLRSHVNSPLSLSRTRERLLARFLSLSLPSFYFFSFFFFSRATESNKCCEFSSAAFDRLANTQRVVVTYTREREEILVMGRQESERGAVIIARIPNARARILFCQERECYSSVVINRPSFAIPQPSDN